MAFWHWQVITDCAIVDCERLWANLYFIPDDATYSPAYCWSPCCSVPMYPSASCRRAVRRFSWNSVQRSECPSLRTICTTTIRGILRTPKIVLSGVHPLKDRFPTSRYSILSDKYPFSKPFPSDPSGW
jgi:hypothetical protein